MNTSLKFLDQYPLDVRLDGPLQQAYDQVNQPLFLCTLSLYNHYFYDDDNTAPLWEHNCERWVAARNADRAETVFLDALKKEGIYLPTPQDRLIDVMLMTNEWERYVSQDELTRILITDTETTENQSTDMNVTVWNYDGYDIASPTSGDAYNFFAVKDASKVTIEEKAITVGPVCFQIGQDFNRLGNGKKTSAGYFSLQLEPENAIRFVGTANSTYLLFRKVKDGAAVIPANRDLFGRINRDYLDIYITFLAMEDGTLFWISGAGGGRIIEL